MGKKKSRKFWHVELGMLDRQVANIVIEATGNDEPDEEMLSRAYREIDSDWQLDPAFSPDEGTHFVLGEVSEETASKSIVVDLTGSEPAVRRPVRDLPEPESWYCWRVHAPVPSCVDGLPDEKPRLIVPWSDPHLYEFPFDFIYESEEEARKGLEDNGASEDALEERWVICKMTLEPVGRAPSPTDNEED